MLKERFLLKVDVSPNVLITNSKLENKLQDIKLIVQQFYTLNWNTDGK